MNARIRKRSHAGLHEQVGGVRRGILSETASRGGRILGLVLLLFLVQGMAPAQPVSQKSIRVVMDNNYPPFAFADAHGKLQGILVDEWRLWESRTGIRAELQGMNWSEALRRMRAGEFDVIDTVFKTPERAELWDFSQPYARIEVLIFFDRDISGITGLQSLKGFAVAAKAGDAAAELLQQHGISTLLLFTNYEAIVSAAKEHKANVFVMDKPPALYLLNKLGIQDEFRHSAPVNTGEFRRAVQKGNAALLQKVDQGFALLNPAELRRIEQKWYGMAIPGHPSLKSLLYILLSGLGLILALLAWNLGLRHLVRRRTAALEQSERKFRDIFENAPLGIFQSTREGKLLNVNASGARMFGYNTPEEFVAAATDMGRQLFVLAGLRQQMVREACECMGFVRHEVEYRRRDKSMFTANLSMRAVRRPDGEVGFVEGFVEDITERKRAEAELRRINRTMRMLTECNQALVRATHEGQLLQSICDLLVVSGGYLMAWVGFARQDEAKSVVAVARAGVDSGYLDAAQITWADTQRGRGPTGVAIRTGQTVIARNFATDPTLAPWRDLALERGFGSSAALPLKLNQGVLGALMVYATEADAFDRPEEELLEELAGDMAFGIGALRTRAENEHVQEQLHQLSARLLQVRDAERRHLARELHDTTAQHLAALTLNLSNLKALVPDSSLSAQALCRDSIQLAQKAAQEIRTHSYLLHPPLLEVMGLVGAVEDYVQGFSSRSGIAVELDSADDFGRLPGEVELALFRVVQECLANVLKHSHSVRARIRLRRDAAAATLEVRDLGQGITPDKLARIQRLAGGSGVGFGGMQERLRLLGGRLEIESTPPGTTVRATVPTAPRESVLPPQN